MKYLVSIALMIISVNSFAYAQCTSIRIKSISANGNHVSIVPEQIGPSGFDKWWTFDIDGTANPEVVSMMKMAFSLNRAVSFKYYGTNDDGDVVSGAPVCKTNELYNWETGTRIFSVTVEAN